MAIETMRDVAWACSDLFDVPGGATLRLFANNGDVGLAAACRAIADLCDYSATFAHAAERGDLAARRVALLCANAIDVLRKAYVSSGAPEAVIVETCVERFDVITGQSGTL